MVCANITNVYIAKAQMYNLRLGNETSWSNTGVGARGAGTLQKWWESQMWSCSLVLLDFKKTPCCILSSELPTCPVVLLRSISRKLFFSCILSCESPSWLLDWWVRRGVNTCPRIERKQRIVKTFWRQWHRYWLEMGKLLTEVIFCDLNHRDGLASYK